MWPVSIASAGIVAVAVGACGGSGSDPSGSSNSADTASAATLLKQTFTGSRDVRSGVVQMNVTVTPHDSSLISGDVVFSLNGPFQSEGADKLPDSDLTLSIQAEGQKATMQLISADGKGYVVLGGTPYSLPASSFKQLESSVSAAAVVGSGSSADAEFKRLGINPLSWLSHPTVAGQAQLNGQETTHIHADVNPTPMLRDLSRLLSKAGQLGVNTGGQNVPSKIPPATQHQIAHALGTPSLDVWTGTSNQTLRKLALAASIPVTGSASNSLGGMTSADFALTFQYSDLNQPQTIQAPANPQPYSALRTQVDSLIESVLQAVGTGVGTAGPATLNPTTTGTVASTGLTGADQRYSRCIVAAKTDATKLQACTKLLNSGG
jgi:hypothetical protein